MRHLRVAGEFAVYPEVKAGVDALEVYVGTPLRRKFDVAQVESRGVFVRHERRIEGEGVAHVDIGGFVVAVKLPHGRHRQRLNGQREVRADRLLRHLLRRAVEGEAPFAAERSEKRRRFAVRERGSGFMRRDAVALGVGDIIRPRRFAPQVQYFSILMEYQFHKLTAFVDITIITETAAKIKSNIKNALACCVKIINPP